MGEHARLEFLRARTPPILEPLSGPGSSPLRSSSPSPAAGSSSSSTLRQEETAKLTAALSAALLLFSSSPSQPSSTIGFSQSSMTSSLRMRTTTMEACTEQRMKWRSGNGGFSMTTHETIMTFFLPNASQPDIIFDSAYYGENLLTKLIKILMIFLG